MLLDLDVTKVLMKMGTAIKQAHQFLLNMIHGVVQAGIMESGSTMKGLISLGETVEEALTDVDLPSTTEPTRATISVEAEVLDAGAKEAVVDVVDATVDKNLEMGARGFIFLRSFQPV